jgi:hypothetical protein
MILPQLIVQLIWSHFICGPFSNHFAARCLFAIYQVDYIVAGHLFIVIMIDCEAKEAHGKGDPSQSGRNVDESRRRKSQFAWYDRCWKERRVLWWMCFKYQSCCGMLGEYEHCYEPFLFHVRIDMRVRKWLWWKTIK